VIQCRCQKGMTLVEVMVATMIFSMVMLATVTAMRTFATSYQKIVAEVETTDRMREVSHFLRQSLQSAVAESKFVAGGKRQLDWLAPVDRAGSAAGLQHLRLQLEDDVLMLSFAAYDVKQTDVDPTWGRYVPDYPLITDVTDFSLAYQMARGNAWASSTRVKAANGEDADQVPWAVSITVTTVNGSWPPIVVHLDAAKEAL